MSKSRIWIWLAVVFPLSWALWIPVIIDKANPMFLDLGGGPALAAMWVVARRAGRRVNPARIVAFAAFFALAFAVISLNAPLYSNPPSPLRFDPWLLAPAAIPAWILSGAFSSDSGVRTLLRGIVTPPNWRWPVIVLLILPVFMLATALIGRLLGLPVQFPARGLTASQLASVTAIRFFHYLLFGATFEEPGWRGFLLPELLRRYSPLAASVVLWLPWAIWHLPLDVTRPGWSVGQVVMARMVVLPIFSILLTWAYERSGRGLLSPLIFHAATGSFPYLLPFSPPLLIPLAIVFMIGAVVSSRMWRTTPQAKASAA
jgi:membrane protease YdiL (CAAX protease family)